MGKYDHIKEEAFQANMQLSSKGMVILNFGHASAVDHKLGVFAIKPHAGPYELYTPSDMVIVDFDANIVNGNEIPSPDAKTHAILYKNWGEIGGIVQTQSAYASAWAQAGRMIPVPKSYGVDFNYKGVPCTSSSDDDEVIDDLQERVAYQIINHFKKNEYSYEQLEMVLVGNYSPLTWGINPAKAVSNSATLEDIARKTLFMLLENATHLNLTDSAESARCITTELILFRIKQEAKLIFPL